MSPTLWISSSLFFNLIMTLLLLVTLAMLGPSNSYLVRTTGQSFARSSKNTSIPVRLATGTNQFGMHLLESYSLYQFLLSLGNLSLWISLSNSLARSILSLVLRLTRFLLLWTG